MSREAIQPHELKNDTILFVNTPLVVIIFFQVYVIEFPP